MNYLETLHQLETIIRQRKTASPETSYSAKLLHQGVDRIAKKVGEEASEVIIAAKNRDINELNAEAADLIYHLLLLLCNGNSSIEEVCKVLDQRMKKN